MCVCKGKSKTKDEIYRAKEDMEIQELEQKQRTQRRKLDKKHKVPDFHVEAPDGRSREREREREKNNISIYINENGSKLHIGIALSSIVTLFWYSKIEPCLFNEADTIFPNLFVW